MKTQAEVIIYRNRGVVFEHLTDPEKLKNWVEDFVSATPVSELAPNAPYRQVIHNGWSEEEMKGHVTEFTKNECFSFSLMSYASQIAISFRLFPHDGESATRLVAIEEVTPLSIIAKMMISVLKLASKEKQVTDLKRLKIFLDRGGDKPL